MHILLFYDLADLQPENQTIIKDEDLSDSENHETEERMDRKVQL